MCDEDGNARLMSQLEW